MKPVLHEVIDKNGAKSVVFNPTAQMILYSIYKADHPELPDADICDQAGISRELPGSWRRKYKEYFTNWIEEAIDAGTSDDRKVLERVGMMQAVQAGNYQYWRDMARTKGVIKEPEQKPGLTVNTNFTQILVEVGGNFEAARARILQAARGVEDGSIPGLAGPAHGGEHPGAGAGAGEVQDRPVVLANALGANRGRAKSAQPVPAVPERPAFTSSYEVLDDGEVPPSTEK